MDKNIKIINIILAITDTLIAALSIIAFGAAAYIFGKWWILLFTLFPIALFYSHSIIINADIQEAELENLIQNKAKTLDERDDKDT